jgi:hypothetical protein
MCMTYQNTGMANNFSLVCWHCTFASYYKGSHCVAWILGAVFCLFVSLFVRLVHHFVRNVLLVWVICWVLILKNGGNVEFMYCTLFVTVVLAGTSNTLDCLPVCSVFWTNLAVIYVNFFMPWDLYLFLYFSMYFSVLDGLILVFGITVVYLRLTYIHDTVTCLMWILHID